MRSGFATLAVVGIAAAVAVYAVSFAPSSKSLYSNVLTHNDMEFLKFVSKYGKSYGTKEEFEFRADQFKENLAQIMNENSKNENTFTLAVNKFADMSNDEYKRLLSYKPMRGSRKAPVATSSVGIPASIDWRTLGAVNPVKDQGQCGSCWAFSTIGAVEGGWFVKSGTLLSLSEQELVDCDINDGNMGCNGGNMDLAMAWIQQNGVQSEASYPYVGIDQNCAADHTQDALKAGAITGVQGVAANNKNALLTAIAGAPVSVAIEADTFVFQFYSGGVLNSQACGTNLDHGVVAVGYD